MSHYPILIPNLIYPTQKQDSGESTLTVQKKKKKRQSTFRDRSGVPGATIRQMGWHSEVSWKTHDITVLKEKWKEARDKHNALDSSAEEVFLLSRCV